jgi:hypothetical protein
MSDEKSDAVSQRDVRFALAALSEPTSRAEQFVRRARLVWPTQIVVAFVPAMANFGLAVYSLWLIFTGQSAHWQDFWTRTIATLALAIFALILLGLAIRRRLFPTIVVLQIHQGVQALRQTAASGDNKLAVVRSDVTWTDASSNLTDSVFVGPLQGLNQQRIRSVLVLGLILIVIGVGPGTLALFAFAQEISPDNAAGLAAAIMALILGLVSVARAVPRLRSFTITSDQQGFRWQPRAFWLRLGTVKASWQDARAFITFEASKDGKSADVDEIFLLDTANEALAWRITPKTPPNVRTAHERFVRVANEHVPLRDITASLKDLLASPETRSYEYAVTALSSPAPVPPAVRKVLTTPVRESHFLRGYLIVAAVLLALLVAAGLLLQSGLIPAGTF